MQIKQALEDEDDDPPSPKRYGAAGENEND
jgi:hypothetical protein